MRAALPVRTAPTSRVRLRVRRGTAVLSAALLTLGVAPFVGTAAAAEPKLATTSPAAGARVQPTRTVSATYDVPLDPASTIAVTASTGNAVAGSKATVSTPETITFTAQENLKEGAYAVAVYAVNALDKKETRTTFSFTVDGSKPAGTTLALKDPAAPAPIVAVNASNAHAVPVSGLAEAGSTVTLTAGTAGTPGAVTKKVDVSPAGTYSDTLDLRLLPDGADAVTVSAKATDAAGNVEHGTASVTTSKDTVVPLGTTVDLPATVNAAEGVAVVVSGRAERDTQVDLLVTSDGNPAGKVATAVSAGSGTYSVKLDLSGLADGRLSATATATDQAGNTSAPATDTAAKDTVAPAITVQAPPVISSKNVHAVQVTGATEPLRAVTVTLGALEQTATAGTNGAYSATFDATSLDEGPVAAGATTTDAAGNPGSVTVAEASVKDTMGPIGTTVKLPVHVNANTQREVEVSGVAEPGGKVAITIVNSDVPVQKVTVSTDVAPTGAYSTKADLSSLLDGPLTATAVATDGNGNTQAEAAATQEGSVKDVAAPSATVTAPEYAEQEGSKVTLPVTVAASENGTVEVVVTDSAGKTAVAPLAVNKDTAATATVDIGGLADGVLKVAATPTDAAGNSGAAASPAKPSVKDTVAPGAPVIAPLQPVNAANASAYALSGTAEPGSSVEVVVADASPATGDVRRTVKAADDGSFALSRLSLSDLNVSQLHDGLLTVSVHATDAAGNIGGVTTAADGRALTVLKDTKAPDTPVLDKPAVVFADNAGAYRISGVAEPGTDVAVSVTDGVKSVTAKPRASTDRTFDAGDLDLRGLADGQLTVTASATDAAGNTGTKESATVQKDTAAPPAPLIASVSDPVTRDNVTAAAVNGTAEVGSVVTVAVDDTDASTPAVVKSSEVLTADSLGSYKIGLDLSALKDPSVVYTVTARDAAGNVSASTTRAATRNVTLLAPTTSSPQPTAEVATPTVRIAPEVSVTFNEAISTSTSTLTVRDSLDNLVAGTTTVDGNRILFVPSVPFTDGTYTAAYDVAERAAPGTDTVTGTFGFTVDAQRQGPPTVTRFTSPVNATTQDAAVVQGSTERAGTVAVTVDDASAATPPVTTQGVTVTDPEGVHRFSITLPSLAGLEDGTVMATVTATETTPDGPVASSPAVATSLKDTVAPAGTTVSVTDPITQANQGKVQVTGKAEPGSTISSTLTGGTTTLTGTPATALANGTYVVPFDATSLPEGAVTASVVASDAVGNPAPAVTATSTKDAEGPAIVDLKTEPVTSANHDKVSVTGRTEPGRPVNVTMTDGRNAALTSTTGSLVDGTFGTTVDARGLANDQNLTVLVQSTDVHGNTRTTTTTTYKDAVAPAGTTVVLSTVNRDSAGALYVTGLAEPGSAVSVTISDAEPLTDVTKTPDVGGTATAGPASAGNLGTYRVGPLDLTALREGELFASATATDQFKNSSVPVTTKAMKDTIAPVITRAEVPVWVSLANLSAVPVTGSTSGDASQVTVSVDDVDAGTAAVVRTWATSGDRFSEVLNLTALSDTPDSSLVTTITVTDASGNRSTATRTSTKDTVAPAVARLAATDVNVERWGTTVSGGTEQLSDVSVFVTDGKATVSGAGTAAGDGAFSLPIDARSLANGTLSVTALGTDRAGNKGVASEPVQAQKDAVAPTLTTVDLDTVALANERDALVTGAAEPNSSITVTVGDAELGGDGTALAPTQDVVGTVRANGDGVYALALDLSGLHDGDLTARALETDAAGNLGSPVTAVALKDTLAPQGTTASAPAVVSTANQAAVAVSGTTEPGALVTVGANDTDATTSPVVRDALAGDDGGFRVLLDLTPLAQGLIQVQVVGTDEAGNDSEPVALTSSKDTVGPAVGVLGFTGPVTQSNAGTTQASGATEAGAEVAVTVTDGAGQAASGVGTAGSDGTFAVPVPVGSLADGVLAVTVRATDVHGNTGAPRTTTVQKDTTTTSGGTQPAPVESPSPSVSPPTSPSPSPSISPPTSPNPSASPSPSTSPSTSPSPTPTTVAPRNGAGFIALTSPTRVLDSRDGTGTARGVKRGRVVLDLSEQIPTGATAAVLNLTVTNPTANGFVVVYPDGNAKPGTSNVNFVRNQTQANEVVVGLPASRRVVVFVDSANANVIADLVGFFTESDRPDLGRVITQAPVRVLDSRDGTGTTRGRKRNEVVLDLTGKVPAGTTSVALNVTVAGPSARGFVVVYPSGTARPGTSNVNFELGQTQANEVVTRLGTGASAGKVSLFVDSATAAVIVDLVASVVPRDGNGSQLFTALGQPQRVMDTRDGTGTGRAGRRSGSVALTLPTGAVPAGATGVVLNVTTTGASRTGFVSVFPTGTANPGTSNVNFRPGINQANEVLTAINGSRQVTLLVGGSGDPLTHVIVDVVGYLTETG